MGEVMSWESYLQETAASETWTDICESVRYLPLAPRGLPEMTPTISALDLTISEAQRAAHNWKKLSIGGMAKV